MTPEYYLLIMTGDIKPETYGAYPNEIARDMAAVDHCLQDPDRDDDIYRINVINGRPHVVPYSRAFFSEIYVRKGRFSIDGGEIFEGYTDGATWNGFAMPMFTREVAERVIDKYNNYDGQPGGYTGYPFNDPSIVVDPDTKKAILVYGIGSGGWVWEEEEREDGVYLPDEE